jgi:hypothetical protein
MLCKAYFTGLVTYSSSSSLMKYCIVFLLLSVSPDLFGQIHLFTPDKEYPIDWKAIEVPQNDSVISIILNDNEVLKRHHKNFPEYFHFLNLNNDSLPDLIFYWPETSNEPIFEAYTNQGNSLKAIYKENGRITFLEYDPQPGIIKFKLDEVGYSEPPFLNRQHFVTFDPSKKDSYFNAETILHFGGTEFPSEFTKHQLVEVTQPIYKLRMQPEIADNVICDLTAGDKAIAFAEKADSTGRVWYFVKALNNVKKSVKKYYYIGSDSPEGYEQAIYGWLSSRYLKELQE